MRWQRATRRATRCEVAGPAWVSAKRMTGTYRRRGGAGDGGPSTGTPAASAHAACRRRRRHPRNKHGSCSQAPPPLQRARTMLERAHTCSPRSARTADSRLWSLHCLYSCKSHRGAKAALILYVPIRLHEVLRKGHHCLSSIGGGAEHVCCPCEP